jgi:DNA-binding NarL/FixJ family response regulator
LPVIFLTARTNVEERIRGYRLGCDVYLPKPFELEELGAVVRNLLERSQMIESEWRQRIHSSELGTEEEAEGKSRIGNEPNIQRAMQTQPSSTLTLALELTPREQEVLAVVVEGLSNGQIGDRLHLSPRTIEKHVSSLLRKTETNNRAELVRFALEHRLLEQRR